MKHFIAHEQMANSLVVLNNLAEPVLNRTAAVMVQDYRNKGGWDNGQTKSVFFTKKEIDNFTALMQLYGAGGVNVYFGCYPDDGSENPTGRNYESRRTVVFVFADANGVDFFDVETDPSTLPSVKF